MLVVVASKFQKKARCSLRPVYPPPPRARAPKRCGAKRESRRRTGPASLFSRASLVSSRGIAFCNARKSEETAIYPETCPLRRIRTVLNGKRFRRENERKRELGGNLEKKRARWIREQSTHFCAGWSVPLRDLELVLLCIRTRRFWNKFEEDVCSQSPEATNFIIKYTQY